MPAPRDSGRHRLKVRLLGAVAAAAVRLLGATWRLRITGPDPFAEGTPFVAAIWHEGLLVAAYAWRGCGLAVPVSRSRDGDQVDAALRHLGFAESPRGSSSRGASSLLRAMIRRVRAGDVVGVLPDGPRGPARRAKIGAVALAAATGARLVPVGIAARPARRVGSWDRSLLPPPFARVRCRYGAPLVVPKRAPAEALEAARRELERRLDRLGEELDAELEGVRALPVADAPRPERSERGHE